MERAFHIVGSGHPSVAKVDRRLPRVMTRFSFLAYIVGVEVKHDQRL